MRAPRIGLDLGGTKIEGVVLSPLGKIEKRVRIDTPRESYAASLDAIVALVGQLDAHVSAAAGAECKAPVGIGTPGAWLASARQMKNCNSPKTTCQMMASSNSRWAKNVTYS
jgi:fructokinase